MSSNNNLSECLVDVKESQTLMKEAKHRASRQKLVLGLLGLTVLAIFAVLAFFFYDLVGHASSAYHQSQDVGYQAKMVAMEDSIPNQYIVVLADDGEDDGEMFLQRKQSVLSTHLNRMFDAVENLPTFRMADGALSTAFKVKSEYTKIPGLLGYSVTLSGSALEIVMNDPSVAYVEQDAIMEGTPYNANLDFFSNDDNAFLELESEPEPIFMPKSSPITGSTRTNSCPSNSRQMTEAECRAVSGFRSVGTYREYPRGCYRWSDNQVYYNNHRYGAAEGESAPVCMRISNTCLSQSSAIWNLAASNAGRGTSSRTFNYPAHAGAEVDIYIFDTGIRRTHHDFTGRAVWGFDAITSSPPYNDPEGHGTHVASSAGGQRWGIAKAANLIDVRVLNENSRGTSSGYLAGMNWAIDRVRRNGRTAIMNASLRFNGGSSTVDRATNSASAYALVVVAAGNDSQDSCNVSPARASGAFSVGNVQSNNARRPSSNYGSCTHIFAPGTSIVAASSRNNDDTSSRSTGGTSMAAPHVAGLAALYLRENPGMSVSQLRRRVLDTARSGVVTDTRGSANLYARYSC
jgi:subtilisin family serine protease